MLSAAISVISSSLPAATAASPRPRAVSSPIIPGAALANSTALRSGGCGAWSVAMASTVPSATPASSASASSREASGGFTRVRPS